MNSDLLIEIWSRLKPFVPPKERIDAADAIVAVFDDFGMSDGVENMQDLDRVLAAAVMSRYGAVDDGEGEYDEYG